MSRWKPNGMLLGKFMPPHYGHVYLCDFASRCVDNLSIVVGTLPTEPIPGELRYQWMKTLFPSQRVIHLDEVLPQDPCEHSDFWNLWREALTRVLPNKPDLVFASEHYGHKLAEVLGAEFVPVDRSRTVQSISATEIRNNPAANWEMIPPCVRPYFLKRVCVFGPESTGKSTLATQLADHFGTIAVPEYARTWLDEKGPDLEESHLLRFAHGQAASEDSLAQHARRVLIADSDPLLTTVWSQALYGRCDSKIEALAQDRHYDLYLLADVDVPWVDDGVRYLPERRKEFFGACKATLEAKGRRYVVISGSWQDRFAIARRAVKELLHEPCASG